MILWSLKRFAGYKKSADKQINNYVRATDLTWILETLSNGNIKQCSYALRSFNYLEMELAYVKAVLLLLFTWQQACIITM